MASILSRPQCVNSKIGHLDCSRQGDIPSPVFRTRKSTCRTGHALDLRYQCLLHSSVKYNLRQHNMPRVIRRQHIIHKLLRGRGFHCLCMSKVTDKSPNQSISQPIIYQSCIHQSINPPIHAYIHPSIGSIKFTACRLGPPLLIRNNFSPNMDK